MAEVQRAELWWANLPDPVGSEPGFRRPVVIIQADPFNRGALRTFIAAIVTSNLAWANSPGNVLLGTDVTGLPKPSVVNVLQLFTLDRLRLSEYIETLPPHVMRDVDNGLRLVLEL